MPRPVLLAAKALVAWCVGEVSACMCVYELDPEVFRAEGGPDVLSSRGCGGRRGKERVRGSCY